MNAPLTARALSGAKVIKVGDAAGVILSEEVLAILGVAPGDQLSFTRTPDGLNIAKYDPDFSHTMSVAEEIMREDRDILAVLAK